MLDARAIPPCVENRAALYTGCPECLGIADSPTDDSEPMPFYEQFFAAFERAKFAEYSSTERYIRQVDLRCVSEFLSVIYY